MNMMAKACLLLLLLAICAYRGANAVCYPAPSYQATATRYTCRLHQSNWASESYFEIVYKHCLEEPTIHVFIRNFYGIDEINMDFSKKSSNWKTTSFTGRTSMIAFLFSTFKPNPKYGLLKQTQIQVYFFAVFGKPDGEHLLTAVFPAHDTSDCSWVSTLALHNRIFFGFGLLFAFILIIVMIYCYRKHCTSNNNRNNNRRYEWNRHEKTQL